MNRKALVQQWQARTVREQRLLKLLGLVLVLACVWWLAILPAWRALETARTTLPELRLQAAQLETILFEAQALKEQPVRIQEESSEQAIRFSLEMAGLNAHLHGIDAQAWRIEFDQAAARLLMQWLAEVPSILNLRITALDLTRSRQGERERPGWVSGFIELDANSQSPIDSRTASPDKEVNP